MFNPSTKKCQRSQYWLIIVDKHCSHIISDLIEFCRGEKIIPTCLPPHTTHLLQPLDVSLFFSLANAYWRALCQKFQLTKVAFVSKTNFIIIYQEVRDQIAKKSTIQHAWQKNDPFPLWLELILDKIAKKEWNKTKPKVQPLIWPRVFHVSVKIYTVLAPLQTSANIMDINRILKKVKLEVYTELNF